ncbi:MAG: UDP-N-acetylmuramoyl-L-alanyl-D-glutamate--2,6-diaminopimelate ligase [Chloroflexi bacterium]|nr:UDP-N-acetylmuramoyl-L-alanyl-D-glutamate--2,6-diaminopimelate ligase [Chloroflexota bacterium]
MPEERSGAKPTRRLAELVAEAPGARIVQGEGERLISGIAFDSRTVQPGDLFVAIPGQRHDGRQFVAQAVARGAAAIAAEAPVQQAGAAAVVQVPSARSALADLAAAFFGHPSRHLKLIGVTGTDGKTSTTRLCAELLEAQGLRCGWLTTVDVKVGGEVRPNPFGHTTPEALGVQALLAEMAAVGDECAVLETSSHALALDRVRGCAFDVAVFTNLAPEHLNFHGSMDAYREAKTQLFLTPGLSHAILNADDPSSAWIARATPAPVTTYGLEAPAEYRAEDLALGADGTSFTLRAPWAPVGLRLRTHFVGRFNVANWLAAIAATVPLGVAAEAIRRAAERARPPSGRMEEVSCGQPFRVVVDFSHTPQALATALATLRPQTAGRLLVVFGQAGERDPGNRPRMGEIAADQADFFVLTSDDPLFEDPVEIAHQIAVGAAARGKREGVDFAIEPDRRAAIRTVCRLARAGDTVLLAGKGHERRMLVRDRREPWSDQQVAREVLAEVWGLGAWGER